MEPDGALCAAPFPSCGCVLGPTALHVSRTRYNKAIHNTTSAQPVLNLVRLQYREDPLFIEVGNVSAQFVDDKSAGASGTPNENVGAESLNAKQLRLDAAVAVRCRAYGFCIDDADRHSKSTFALLRQLFSLQAGQF